MRKVQVADLFLYLIFELHFFSVLTPETFLKRQGNLVFFSDGPLAIFLFEFNILG